MNFVQKDMEAELITFAGDKKVGITSDQKISQQLDDVLAKYHASNAVFISDGAEDETLTPYSSVQDQDQFS